VRPAPITALLASLAAPAAAQDAPPNLLPTRDVAVTYRVTEASEPPTETRMAWSVRTDRLRVDPPGGTEWMLLDRAAGTAAVVTESSRTVATIPASAAARMSRLVPEGATFARRGPARVADTPCTEWTMTVPQGTSTVCLTEDGVLLRSLDGTGDEAFRMEAVRVLYDPPADLFAVPPGYRAAR